MSTDLTQGQALLHASQRSQATLAALAQPTALRFDLPQGYAGSLYRCAPLAPASIGNLSTWLTQQFWRNQNPALHDDLRTLAAAGDNLPALLADIQAGDGGLLGRLFGGQKRRAAEAASAVLAERLASASGALTRLEPIFAQADQLAALTPRSGLRLQHFRAEGRRRPGPSPLRRGNLDCPALGRNPHRRTRRLP